MKKHIWVAAGVAALSIAIGIYALVRSSAAEPAEQPAAAKEPGQGDIIDLGEDGAQLAGVKTARVTRGPVSAVLAATGEVTANTNMVVKVGSIVGGAREKAACQRRGHGERGPNHRYR